VETSSLIGNTRVFSSLRALAIKDNLEKRFSPYHCLLD